MICLFKRPRRIAGRRDGSRQALQRPSSCTPILPLPSPLRLKCCPDHVHLANAPRHMPQLRPALDQAKSKNPIAQRMRTAGSCMGGFATPNGIPNPSPFLPSNLGFRFPESSHDPLAQWSWSDGHWLALGRLGQTGLLRRRPSVSRAIWLRFRTMNTTFQATTLSMGTGWL